MALGRWSQEAVIISPDLRTMRALNDFHQPWFHQGEYSRKKSAYPEGEGRKEGQWLKSSKGAVDRWMVGKSVNGPNG